MANNESVDKVLDRIEAHLLRLEEKVDKKFDVLHGRVTDIQVDGCSKRPDDLRRLTELENWRTKGIVGIIGLAFAILVTWLKGAISGKP